MSKSIKSLTGTKSVKYDTTPTSNLVNFLNNYNTKPVDTTLSNLTDWASTSSADNLSNMGNYTFGADGSEWARTQAEKAYYNSAVDKLTPQFERQRSDYATMLQNQGLPVGSEAYERAMGDLSEKQNDALQQAAYQSILAGQDAFSRSLSDEINAGSFGNNAQQAYINQLLSALTGSSSGYDVAMDKYAAESNQAAQQYAARQQAQNNRNSLFNSIFSAGSQAAGAYFGGK